RDATPKPKPGFLGVIARTSANSNKSWSAICRFGSTSRRYRNPPPRIMLPFAKSSRTQRELAKMRNEIDSLKILAAQPLIQIIRNGTSLDSLRAVEFKVFSQFGDDGIIQYLIHRLAPLPDSFV